MNNLPFRSSQQKLGKLIRFLIAPPPHITDKIEQQKNRLLCSLLLATIVFSTPMTMLLTLENTDGSRSIEIVASITIIVTCILLYWQTRQGGYRWTRWGFIAITSLIFILIPYTATHAMLPFLLMPILLTHIFLKKRRAITINLVIIVLIFLLNQTIKNNHENFYEFRVYWYFIIIGSILITIFIRHTDKIEQIRRQELEVVNTQLRQLDAAKSDFIEVTAHELRTPLTIMNSYAQLITQHPTIQQEKNLQRYVGNLVTGTKRLQEVMNTMLMALKIDSQALNLVPQPMHIQELIDNVLLQLEADIQTRQQVVHVQPAIYQLPAIEADTIDLEVAFRNIIQNAIKYTPDGGKITIDGEVWETPPTPNLPAHALKIIITDAGIGIDPIHLELIFTKFYRIGDLLEHSTSKTDFKGGGAGLGLAIAQGIIEAHHGQLWATSEGHDEERYPGSQFHIILPLKYNKPDETA